VDECESHEVSSVLTDASSTMADCKHMMKMGFAQLRRDVRLEAEPRQANMRRRMLAQV
jgi:hypothetical protein